MGKQKACWQTQRPKVLKGMLAKPNPKMRWWLMPKPLKKKMLLQKEKKLLTNPNPKRRCWRANRKPEKEMLVGKP